MKITSVERFKNAGSIILLNKIKNLRFIYRTDLIPLLPPKRKTPLSIRKKYIFLPPSLFFFVRFCSMPHSIMYLGGVGMGMSTPNRWLMIAIRTLQPEQI